MTQTLPDANPVFGGIWALEYQNSKGPSNLHLHFSEAEEEAEEEEDIFAEVNPDHFHWDPSTNYIVLFFSGSQFAHLFCMVHKGDQPNCPNCHAKLFPSQLLTVVNFHFKRKFCSGKSTIGKY